MFDLKTRGKRTWVGTSKGVLLQRRSFVKGKREREYLLGIILITTKKQKNNKHINKKKNPTIKIIIRWHQTHNNINY